MQEQDAMVRRTARLRDDSRVRGEERTSEQACADVTFAVCVGDGYGWCSTLTSAFVGLPTPDAGRRAACPRVRRFSLDRTTRDWSLRKRSALPTECRVDTAADRR